MGLGSVLGAVAGAAGDVVSRPLRGLALLCAAFSAALLAALVWAAWTYLVPLIPWQGWLGVGAEGLASVAVLVVAVILAPLVMMIAGGVLLDVAAERVERLRFPDQPVGTGLSPPKAIAASARIAAVAVPLNLIAAPLLFVPVLGFAVYWIVNGFLLGREYFSLAALRYTDWPQTLALRRRYWGPVFVAGLALALVMSVPFVNAFAPLFGIALMVRLRKSMDRTNQDSRAG